MHTDCSKYQIFSTYPSNWSDLQVRTARILQDIGFDCEIEWDIDTVRGTVNVDVFAENNNSQPKQVLIIECKNWSKRVPKTIVHSFRTVVNDAGANSGMIISKKGFQQGAVTAAKKSNVLTFSWDEFQEYFKLDWLKSIINEVHVKGFPLLEFTDYLADFYWDEFERLDPEQKNLFNDLKHKYSEFAFYCHKDYYLNYKTGEIAYLDRAIDERKEDIPIQIECYSDYFYFIRDYCMDGLNQFDKLFGKKIRK